MGGIAKGANVYKTSEKSFFANLRRVAIDRVSHIFFSAGRTTAIFTFSYQ
jgi:hypothetical protein